LQTFVKASIRSFSLGVLAERKAASAVCLDAPPKQRLLYACFKVRADKMRSDQASYLHALHIKKQQITQLSKNLPTR